MNKLDLLQNIKYLSEEMARLDKSIREGKVAEKRIEEVEKEIRKLMYQYLGPKERNNPFINFIDCLTEVIKEENNEN